MTKPTAAPTDSDQSLAEAPEATTLRGSLNGDAAPTVRPVTRADDNAGDLRATAAPVTDNDAGTSSASVGPHSLSDLDAEHLFLEEWNGIYVGHTVMVQAGAESWVL